MELKETQLYNNVPNNIDKSNSFVETDYSRDFYRYKCKNRIRIGANRMFVDKIPDKLYRIEGTLYNEKSNINCKVNPTGFFSFPWVRWKLEMGFHLTKGLKS